MNPVATHAPRTTTGISEKVNLAMSKSSLSETLEVQPWLKSIGETAAETGLTASAIRFYERRGLIRPARSGGQRWFSSEDRKRLRLIATLKSAGMRLSAIAEILNKNPGASKDWKRVVERYRRQWRADLAQLRDKLARADALMHCACSDAVACPQLG
jgi:MerR family redox-sensitive transcriptional activator SoxR